MTAITLTERAARRINEIMADLIGQSFKIENPHATASCGCGTSFSL